MIDRSEPFGEALGHVLVGLEEYGAQDQLAVRPGGNRIGRHRVHAHHEAVRDLRQGGGDPFRHRRARRDQHLRPPRRAVHDHGLPGGHRAQRRIQCGGLGPGQEVQGVGQEGPPLTPGREEAHVVQGHSTAAARGRRLPAHQPGRTQPALHADDLDVLPAGPLQVRADLETVPGGSACGPARHVDGYRGCHGHSLVFSGRWKMSRHNGDRRAECARRMSPALPAAAHHQPTGRRCREICR